MVHALLLTSPEAMHADAIREELGVSRSNVSTSLRELHGWGMVRVVHVLGDRRDHFEPVRDVWELFRAIIVEHERRWLRPLRAGLAQHLQHARDPKNGHDGTHRSISALLEFLDVASMWYGTVRDLPPTELQKHFVDNGVVKH
jgi:DNA-binding transcriptional regulator GbsR (MarR family)